jgi:hypothetical protein
MATTTLRLGLSKKDVNDVFNEVLYDNGNADILDASIGFTPCTSATRPSSPFNGMAIRETDTGRFFVSNGSAPASASWVQLLNSLSDITLTNHSIILSGGSANLTVGGSASVAGNLSLPTTGTSKLLLGPDVNLYWGASNVLKTDDSLQVVGNLTLTTTASNLSVGGSASVIGNLVVGGRITGISNLSGEATAGLTLSTSYQNVPGAFVTFTTTKANTVVKARVTADGSWGSGLANSDFISVIVSVDGTDLTTGGAVATAPGSAFVGVGIPISGSIPPITLASAGSHTIQLRARRASSSTGSAALNVLGVRASGVGGCRVDVDVFDI